MLRPDRRDDDSTAESATESKSPRPANKQGNPATSPATARVLAKYPDMWEAFQERQSANHVHKVCKVSFTTARRAVEEGWPRYKLPALRERWIALRKEVERKENYKLRTRMGEAMRVCQETEGVLEEFTTQLRVIDFRLLFSQRELRKLGPKGVLELLKTAVEVTEKTEKLKAFLGGRPTGKTEVEHTHKVQLPRIQRIQDLDDEALDGIIAQVEADRAGRWKPSPELLAWVGEELAKHGMGVPRLPAVSRETGPTETPPAEVPASP